MVTRVGRFAYCVQSMPQGHASHDGHDGMSHDAADMVAFVSVAVAGARATGALSRVPARARLPNRFMRFSRGGGRLVRFGARVESGFFTRDPSAHAGPVHGGGKPHRTRAAYRAGARRARAGSDQQRAIVEPERRVEVRPGGRSRRRSSQSCSDDLRVRIAVRGHERRTRRHLDRTDRGMAQIGRRRGDAGPLDQGGRRRGEQRAGLVRRTGERAAGRLVGGRSITRSTGTARRCSGDGDRSFDGERAPRTQALTRGGPGLAQGYGEGEDNEQRANGVGPIGSHG